MWKGKINHIDTTWIKWGLDMDTNVVSVKSASLWGCLYVLSNIWATFEAQFIKKLSNTEAELKKALFIKNASSFFRFLMYLELAYHQVLDFW